MLKSIRKKVAEIVPATGDIAGRLRDKHAAAITELAGAQAAYRAATLDAEIADGTPEHTAAADRKAELAKQIARLEARVADLAGAIEAAAEQADRQTAADAQAEASRRWDLTLRHTEARLVAVREVEVAIATLADARARLIKSAAEIKSASPIDIEPDIGLLGADHIDAAIRLALVRAGFRWAFGWPWEPERIPTLVDKMITANEHISYQRPGAPPRPKPQRKKKPAEGEEKA